MTEPRTAPVRKRRKPWYGLTLVVTGVLLVGLEVVIYLALVASASGSYAWFGSVPPDPAMLQDLKVAVLSSQATSRMYAKDPESYYAFQSQWEKALKKGKVPFRVVSEADLVRGLGDSTVLILPEVSCLGDPQRQSISNFLAGGGGIVASGALGARDGNCEWRGWDFLTNFAEIESPSSVAPTSPLFAGFRGRAFFSDQVPTGYKLDVSTEELIVGTSNTPDAYWSDWRLQPAQGQVLANVALATHSIKPSYGRAVWFGFNETLAREKFEDRKSLDGYMLSAVHWAGKQPLAAMGNWPKGKQAGLMVAESVQKDFANASLDAKVFAQAGIPATFFCDSSAALGDQGAVQDFRSRGEVATLGDTLIPFVGQSSIIQTQRLMRAKRELAEISSANVAGFAPPQGLANADTLAALSGAGYQYYLEQMDIRRGVPELLSVTNNQAGSDSTQEVTRIFRTSADDFEVIAGLSTPTLRNEDMAAKFIANLDNSVSLGTLDTFYFHSYLLGAPEHVDALKMVVNRIKAEPVWMGTGQDIVRWWSGREGLQVESRRVSPHRIELKVTNAGHADVSDADVYVFLPYRPHSVSLTSSVFRLRNPSVQMLPSDDALRVEMPTLAAQTNYTYLIGLDE